MGRVPRCRLGRGVYHVINRGINNSWVLESEEDRDKFLELLVSQKINTRISIYHWAIMSNHFHLAVEALNVRELSCYLSKVSSLYSRYWHKKHGTGRGTIWQGRFKSVVVQKEGCLLRLGRYIERNPIAAGIEGIKVPTDYRWSSAATYVEGREDPIVDAHRHPYWLELGGSDNERRIFYGNFITKTPAEDAELFSSGASIIGDKEFAANIMIESGRLSARPRGRPRKV
ncbi:MAG: hypothetical protein A2X45_12450 [Lentisphaerae bacterium GWF2_50_93]|nr:MAG: hypothetical protein A2X45_12450 [Lentisphaerae bacterium GWF2_50_93]